MVAAATLLAVLPERLNQIHFSILPTPTHFVPPHTRNNHMVTISLCSDQVEAGADLGTFNSEALTALDIAAGRNHLLVECYLRTEGAVSSTQFWTAADSGLFGILEQRRKMQACRYTSCACFRTKSWAILFVRVKNCKTRQRVLSICVGFVCACSVAEGKNVRKKAFF